MSHPSTCELQYIQYSDDEVPSRVQKACAIKGLGCGHDMMDDGFVMCLIFSEEGACCQAQLPPQGQCHQLYHSYTIAALHGSIRPPCEVLGYKGRQQTTQCLISMHA